MKNLFTITLTALALMVPTASASAYQFSFSPHIPHQQRVERAISWQINTKVARVYAVNPASFIPTGGIVIHVGTQSYVWQHCGIGADGCHAPSQIWVDWIGGSLIIDHEVIETEVDRYANSYLDGQLVEPCDAVEGFDYFYGRGDVMLADWVYPAYFTRHHGRRDYLKALPA